MRVMRKNKEWAEERRREHEKFEKEEMEKAIKENALKKEAREREEKLKPNPVAEYGIADPKKQFDTGNEVEPPTLRHWRKPCTRWTI